MLIKTWKTKDKSYSFNSIYFYDIDENVLVLTGTTIDLNTFSTSFALDYKYSDVLSEVSAYFKLSEGRLNFYSAYKGIQEISTTVTSYPHVTIHTNYSIYYPLRDLICDELDITPIVYTEDSNTNVNIPVLGSIYYLKIDKSNSTLLDASHLNHTTTYTKIWRLTYKNKLFFSYSNKGCYFYDPVLNTLTKFYDKSLYQPLYIDDSIIIGTESDSRIITCVDYNNNDDTSDVVYSIDLTDLNSDLENYDAYYFYYNVISRTDTTLELLVPIVLPEVNTDDGLTYEVLHLYKVVINNYKTSDASAEISEYALDFGTFNKYLPKLSDNYIYYVHTINAFDRKYAVVVYGNKILTFVWNDEDNVYELISYNVVKGSYIIQNWFNELELIELFDYEDNGKMVATFLTFNGSSWEINNTIYSKSPIMITRNDTLFYIGFNDELVVDKYVTKPSASIIFEKPSYIYVNNEVIHTSITINSYYYLPETTTRYALTIVSDNAEFATNHSNYFEVEMKNGNYPLKLDITNDGKVEIKIDLIGMWNLTNGIERSFTRKTDIKFNHTIERIWS